MALPMPLVEPVINIVLFFSVMVKFLINFNSCEVAVKGFFYFHLIMLTPQVNPAPKPARTIMSPGLNGEDV